METICPICLDPLNNGHATFKPGCHQKHEFHYRCICKNVSYPIEVEFKLSKWNNTVLTCANTQSCEIYFGLSTSHFVFHDFSRTFIAFWVNIFVFVVFCLYFVYLSVYLSWYLFFLNCCFFYIYKYIYIYIYIFII